MSPTASDETAERGTLLDRVLQAREDRRIRGCSSPRSRCSSPSRFSRSRALPHIDKPIRWELIVVAGLVCVPVIVALNALEFRLDGPLRRTSSALLEIVQITVLGSAANLLPMPGAVMVRLANLRKAGVRVTAGSEPHRDHRPRVARHRGRARRRRAALVAHRLRARRARRSARALLTIGMRDAGAARSNRAPASRARSSSSRSSTAFVLMQAFRLFLVAAALRFDVSFAQTTTLVIAAVAAAAIGFLPSGLGAREASPPCSRPSSASPPRSGS